jgi:hypothetical protein
MAVVRNARGNAILARSSVVVGHVDDAGALGSV